MKKTLREIIFAKPIFYRFFQRLVGFREPPDEVFKRILRLESHQKILDIGCGEGASSSAIAVHVREYVGLDDNEAYIQSARRNVNSANARFIVADAGDTTVREFGPFDLVVVTGVLHHLSSQKIHQMLENVKDVLAVGGRFVALEPVLTPDQGLLARILITSDRGRYVRDLEGYQYLLDQHFSKVDVVIEEKLLRIPYTHLVISGTL